MSNISIATLGVSDLKRSTAFYEALGWRNSPMTQETVTFLQGHSIVLGLFPREELAKDADIVDTPAGFRGVALAFNQPSENAVNTFFEKAVAAGAHPQKRPEKVFWGGYSGYFADPDGHLWEVAHNPFATMDEGGQIDLFAAPSSGDAA
mgnify:CR=1 FL=1